MNNEVLPQVIEFLRRRVEAGAAEYGGPLRTFNGRDAGRDALEEAADLLLYLMQDRMEIASLVEAHAGKLRQAVLDLLHEIEATHGTGPAAYYTVPASQIERLRSALEKYS